MPAEPTRAPFKTLLTEVDDPVVNASVVPGEVFISYARQDEARVSRLVQALERNNTNVGAGAGVRATAVPAVAVGGRAHHAVAVRGQERQRVQHGGLSGEGHLVPSEQPLPNEKPQPPRTLKAFSAYSRCVEGMTKRSS